MTAFYNENDPYAASWLRNLIVAGHIAPGIVDERPIQEIEAWELVGFTQCHFFAGIGVWSHALRRAGWPDDGPIWTGSCPCQPFSAAGQRKGIQDERHLWPTWSKLIEQRKPPVIVGEQVASKDGLGWLDIVSTDMEAAGYAFGASDLCAAGFGGTHIRQRLYFVGLADSLPTGWAERRAIPGNRPLAGSGAYGGLDHRHHSGLEGGMALKSAVSLTGWNTPTSPVNTNGYQAGNNRYTTSVTEQTKSLTVAIRGKLQADGSMLIGSCAEILPENQAGAPLNPEHSRWIMRLPVEWVSCAPTGMRSMRKRQQTSVKPSKKSPKVYDL